jgi:hypothetical protein
MNEDMNPNIQYVLFIDIIKPNNLNKIMNLINLSLDILVLLGELIPLYNTI